MAAYIGFLAGSIIGFGILSLLVRLAFRDKSRPVRRIVMVCVVTFIIGAALAGLGMGEGGFSNRLNAMLSGRSFVAYAPAFLIFMAGWICLHFTKAAMNE